MCNRIFIFFSCLLILSGCTYDDEPMAEITRDLGPARTVRVPVVIPNPEPATNASERIPFGWVPGSRFKKEWTAVIIHHSGTKKGNAGIFDKWHKEGKHWKGVGYHFVIGNGTDSGDGEVEVTFRWREQGTGAHCGGTRGNWANREGVGICLVGDFNRTSPSRRQMNSLVRLVGFLQKQCGIPKSRIYGHGTTPGANKTECPGKKFPMAWLKSML